MLHALIRACSILGGVLVACIGIMESPCKLLSVSDIDRAERAYARALQEVDGKDSELRVLRVENERLRAIAADLRNGTG